MRVVSCLVFVVLSVNSIGKFTYSLWRHEKMRLRARLGSVFSFWCQWDCISICICCCCCCSHHFTFRLHFRCFQFRCFYCDLFIIYILCHLFSCLVLSLWFICSLNRWFVCLFSSCCRQFCCNFTVNAAAAADFFASRFWADISSTLKMFKIGGGGGM